MSACADAIGMGDLAGAIDREPDPLHAIIVDHPSVNTRLPKAECGAYVLRSEIAGHVDAVTCRKCRRVLDIREDISI